METQTPNRRIYTRGNVEVQDIKVGDIHWEYEYGFVIKSKVITLPARDETGFWHWKSESDGIEIDYGVSEEYGGTYGPKLYDYPAYHGAKSLYNGIA